MAKMAEKGKKYRVIKDYICFFEPGAIIVSLEDDDTPYCVSEENYIPENDLDDYDDGLVCVMLLDELEEIEEGEK